jgi:hypothetical protein
MTTQICACGIQLQLRKGFPPFFGGDNGGIAQSVPLLSPGTTGLVVPLVDAISATGDASEASLLGLSALGSRAEPKTISTCPSCPIEARRKTHIRSEPLNPWAASTPIPPRSTAFLLVPPTTPGLAAFC